MGLFSNLFGGGNFGEIARSIAEHHNRLGSFPDVLSIYYEDFKSRSPDSKRYLKAQVAARMIEGDYLKEVKTPSETIINNYLGLAVLALSVDAAPADHMFSTVMDHSGKAVLKQLREQGLHEWAISGNYYHHNAEFLTFKRLAEQGKANRYELDQLAKCYGSGFPTAIDHKEAFKYFKESAMLGYGKAMSTVGRYYTGDLAVEEDYVRAFAWYILADTQGEETAMSYMQEGSNRILRNN